MRIVAAFAFARHLLAFACLLCFPLPTVAAINAYGLGATYDSTRSNVIFRVYSSRATRIEVDLYAARLPWVTIGESEAR
jgi:hypothetical protein